MADVFRVLPTRALAVYAHPDDADIACGGTLATWAKRGADVRLLVLGDGAKGTRDPNADVSELARRRSDELHDAAGALGLSASSSWGSPTGRSRTTSRRGARRGGAPAAATPTVVLAPDPTATFFGGVYVNHRDHRRPAGWPRRGRPGLGDAALLPRGRGPPHAVETLLLSGTLDADVVVDIDGTLDAKIAAVLSHRSQLRRRRRVGQCRGRDARAVQAGRLVGVDPRRGVPPRRARRLTSGSRGAAARDPARRPRLVLRVRRGARRPVASGPAGHRRAATARAASSRAAPTRRASAACAPRCPRSRRSAGARRRLRARPLLALRGGLHEVLRDTRGRDAARRAARARRGLPRRDRLDGAARARPSRSPRAIRSRVRDELSLSCCVGVARNKLFAKLASRRAKPVASPAGIEPGARGRRHDARRTSPRCSRRCACATCGAWAPRRPRGSSGSGSARSPSSPRPTPPCSPGTSGARARAAALTSSRAAWTSGPSRPSHGPSPSGTRRPSPSRSRRATTLRARAAHGGRGREGAARLGTARAVRSR